MFGQACVCFWKFSPVHCIQQAGHNNTINNFVVKCHLTVVAWYSIVNCNWSKGPTTLLQYYSWTLTLAMLGTLLQCKLSPGGQLTGWCHGCSGPVMWWVWWVVCLGPLTKLWLQVKVNHGPISIFQQLKIIQLRWVWLSCLVTERSQPSFTQPGAKLEDEEDGDHHRGGEEP